MFTWQRTDWSSSRFSSVYLRPLKLCFEEILQAYPYPIQWYPLFQLFINSNVFIAILFIQQFFSVSSAVFFSRRQRFFNWSSETPRDSFSPTGVTQKFLYSVWTPDLKMLRCAGYCQHEWKVCENNFVSTLECYVNLLLGIWMRNGCHALTFRSIQLCVSFISFFSCTYCWRERDRWIRKQQWPLRTNARSSAHFLIYLLAVGNDKSPSLLATSCLISRV